MAKIKHSKYKNVGLLFEILTRKVTYEMLNKQEPTALRILKKHFKPYDNCELTKASKLYSALCNETTTPDKAERLLTLIEHLWNRLDHKKLNEESYELVKDIKNKYEESNFFGTRIPHYIKLASAYQILNYRPTTDPKKHFDLRESLLESISTTDTKEDKDVFIREWRQHDKEIRTLAFKNALRKFNSKYNTLSKAQKSLLSRYITEDTSSQHFREFIYSELNKVTQQLNEAVNRLEDKILRIKLDEVLNLSDEIIKAKRIEDNHLVALMKYYELAEVLSSE